MFCKGIKVLLLILLLNFNIMYASVVLHDEVYIKGNDILFADLVKDNPLNLQIPDINLGNAPLPGRMRILHRNHILHRLNISRSDIDVTIPDSVEVRTKSQDIDIDIVHSTIISFIESQIRDSYDYFTVEIVRLNTRNQMLPADVFPEYSIRLNNRSELKGRIIGYVDIIISDDVYSTLNFVVDITASKYFPVLKEDIGHREVIDSNMIEVRLIDITRLNTLNAITDKNEIISKMTRRSLRKGNIIEQNHLTEQYAVNNRDIVSVIVEQNGFIIRTEAQAMQSGTIGQRIRLLNLNSNKTFFAKISNVNEVIVR